MLTHTHKHMDSKRHLKSSTFCKTAYCSFEPLCLLFHLRPKISLSSHLSFCSLVCGRLRTQHEANWKYSSAFIISFSEESYTSQLTGANQAWPSGWSLRYTSPYPTLCTTSSWSVPILSSVLLFRLPVPGLSLVFPKSERFVLTFSACLPWLLSIFISVELRPLACFPHWILVRQMSRPLCQAFFGIEFKQH